MRLFIAINFTDTVKRQISEIIHYFEPKMKRGRFVHDENLHLTLEFLGDIEEKKIQEIVAIMNTLDFSCFTLYLNKLGYFKSRKGHIYWLGIENNETLMQIQNQLHQNLLENEFNLDNRPYIPHITIGRQMKLIEDLNSLALEKRIKQIEIPVLTIDLMESKMIDGKLTYSVIASKSLN